MGYLEIAIYTLDIIACSGLLKLIRQLCVALLDMALGFTPSIILISTYNHAQKLTFIQTLLTNGA